MSEAPSTPSAPALTIQIPAETIAAAILDNPRILAGPIASAIHGMAPNIHQAVQTELVHLLADDAFRLLLRGALREGLLDQARKKGAELVDGLSKVKTRELLLSLPDPAR